MSEDGSYAECAEIQPLLDFRAADKDSNRSLSELDPEDQLPMVDSVSILDPKDMKLTYDNN